MFGPAESAAAQALIAAALAEDLGGQSDLTTTAVIPEQARGQVDVVVRKPGVICGLPIVPLVFQSLDVSVEVHLRAADGDRVDSKTVVATITGPTRSLLIGERTALNFLTHLSGVASLTAAYSQKVAGTRAKVFDTRKTLPGWRVLQKYAVRCGGGVNHRIGLYDAVLIKDNHLAAWTGLAEKPTLAAAVRRARDVSPRGIPIQVEVDSLDQLRDVLTASPDMVLLDNMDNATLKAAVTIRDQLAPKILLEASGGVTLETIAAIAQTGVDRISVGALTHSVPVLDIAFDWNNARTTSAGLAD